MNVNKIMAELERKHPGESEYLQAVREVLMTVEDAYNQHPEFGVAIPVQNQIIHDKHLINIVFPAHASAKIQRRFIRQSLQLLVGIQGNLRFALCLEILRSAEINLMGSAIH